MFKSRSGGGKAAQTFFSFIGEFTERRMTCRQRQLQFRHCLKPDNGPGERVLEIVPTAKSGGTNRVPSCAGCVAALDQMRGRLGYWTVR